jgi:hypothetical protein
LRCPDFFCFLLSFPWQVLSLIVVSRANLLSLVSNHQAPADQVLNIIYIKLFNSLTLRGYDPEMLGRFQNMTIAARLPPNLLVRKGRIQQIMGQKMLS